LDKDDPDMIRRLPMAAAAILLLAGVSCKPAAINNGGSRPFVDAGSDRCSGEGDPVTLTAEVDGGFAATYRWTLERWPAALETAEGVAEIEIRDAGSAVAVTEALVVQGDYVFRVIVANGKNRSRSSWVTITVGPPGASGDFCVGIDGPTSLNVGVEGTFTATTDREDDLLYHWENVTTNGVVFGSPDEDTTTVTCYTPGDVTIRVVVTDEQTGEVGTNEQTIPVAELPQLAVSIEGPDEAILDQRVELTAVTTNALGTLEYAWTVLAGSADLDDEDQFTVGVTPTEAASLRILRHEDHRGDREGRVGGNRRCRGAAPAGRRQSRAECLGRHRRRSGVPVGGSGRTRQPVRFHRGRPDADGRRARHHPRPGDGDGHRRRRDPDGDRPRRRGYV
jgi:hypothetical protein